MVLRLTTLILFNLSIVKSAQRTLALTLTVGTRCDAGLRCFVLDAVLAISAEYGDDEVDRCKRSFCVHEQIRTG